MAFPALTIVGFLRVDTNPRAMTAQLSVTEACDQLDEWLDQPPARHLNAGQRTAQLMRALLEQAGTGGNLTNDAHLAALAIEHGATLASFDGDFFRFPGLKFDYLHARFQLVCAYHRSSR